jgi:outer membrane protein assembly factor BamB
MRRFGSTNRTRLSHSLSSFVCLLHVLALGASAADWPQYRFDAQRSAASPAQLPSQLNLKWVRELPSPRPAFPDEVRLAFDHAYEPIVMGKTMFVPSMVTDSITALDTDTGAEKWVFFADGPIRFAPVADKGKVYAASDDGYLYCLDAASGDLLWKFRGLPKDRADRKLLGSGRLISLAPARGGPVLDEGVVYFAAGLWPQDGVFVHALDAETGQAIWSNTTSDKIEEANMDHGVAQFAGLTPQGYLARVHEKLVVPCGAQLPAFLDPQTGQLDPYTMGWGGRVGLPKGTWFVAGAGHYLSHGGDLYDISRPGDEPEATSTRRYMTAEVRRRMYPGGFTRLLIDPANQRALGDFRRPVMTEQALYYNDRDAGGIAAFDLAGLKLEDRSNLKTPKYRTKDLFPDTWKGVMHRQWTLPSKLQVHIKAGRRLYAGGPGIVQAIDIPQRSGMPRISWTAEIEGTPHTMLAADGKLFVSTREGRLYAFGGGKPQQVAEYRLAEPQATPDSASAGAEEEILNVVPAREGYALVLGIDEGRVLDELVGNSELYVIAVDSNEESVHRLRKKLHQAGLYGLRATVHVGDPLSYPFPPFLADLVVSEAPDRLGEWWAGSAAASLFHPLRPYGGTACLPVASEASQRASQSLQAAELAGSAVERSGGFVLLTREGPLPDAAAWSHDGADAANTVASQDRFVKAPLDVLWFDSSFRWYRKPGSAEVRVAGGRVFVKTDELRAIDAYTGRHLWTVELPDGFADKSAQMAAVEDGVYLAAGDGACLVFDPASGEQSTKIEVPSGLKGNWSNLRVWNDYLVATIGSELVCLNRHTNDVIWKFACSRPNLATAVGHGKVFCSELFDRRREASSADADTRLRAFDIASGELLWEAPCGQKVHYAVELDWVLTAKDVFDGKDGKRIRDGVASPQIAGTRLISGSKERFSLYDLTAEGAEAAELEWVRRGCTDLRSSGHLVTTRFRANAAYIDLATLEITPLWNIRPGCNNNLYPADGLLNIPNVTGGCECNYTPVSKAFAPRSTIARPNGDVR